MMFGEFNEAGKPKCSLGKYSVKLNDFARPQRNPHRRSFLRLIGRPYTLLYIKRSAILFTYSINVITTLKCNYLSNHLLHCTSIMITTLVAACTLHEHPYVRIDNPTVSLCLD